jgi:hypothetical protein
MISHQLIGDLLGVMPLAGNRLVQDMSVCHSKKTFLGADTT